MTFKKANFQIIENSVQQVSLLLCYDKLLSPKPITVSINIDPAGKFLYYISACQTVTSFFF